MSTHPYIHFQNGQCREAMTFYAEVLGGTDLQTMAYADVHGAPGEWGGSGHLMHAQMKVGNGMLMASDFPPGMEGDPQKAMSVMQTLATVEDAHRAFDRLMEGGALIQPFGPTFWSKGFGMGRDRFGTHWIVSVAETGMEPSAEATEEAEAHPT
jgi:PhnB protein